MKQNREQTTSNARIAVVFIAFLIFVVLISLVVKIIVLIANGQYDGSRRFTLSISNGKNTEIVSLSPSLQNITIFRFNNPISSFQAGQLLEVPVDAYVVSNSLNLDQKANPLFMNLLLNCNKIKTNLTVIDLLRLTMFVRGISNISVNSIPVSDPANIASDNLVGHLMSDDLIEKDSQTIQIINRTDVAGLGSRLARMITNMGGNVILVMSEDNAGKSAITYLDKETYTAERLQKILGYEVVREPSNAIADITIIIGEDNLNSLPF